VPHVFKKKITRYLDAAGKQVPKGTPGARKAREESAKWYGRVPGAVQPVPLCANKTAAQIMLNELVKKAELAKVGVVDPYEKARARPLLDHVKDFKAALEAKGDDPRHVALVVSRLKALLQGCGFVFLADLDGSRVQNWLLDLRRGRRPGPLPAGQVSFTPREAAAALGVGRGSVGEAVRRHGLAATGRGKARRYPRATVEALQDRLGRGASVETTNQYLGHVKAFCRWLVRDGRAGNNPLMHLETGNVGVDRRHDRRELEAEELRRLLDVTRGSTRVFRGLAGADRYALYATACGTGFRAGGLASLTPESFDLDADPPTVTLAARRNKSRVLKVQPLPPDLAELLRGYLAGRPPGQPVWGGTWPRDGLGAEMLRLDLEAAGIPYAMEGPDGPLYADFHALRHTYLTLGSRAGIDLRTLQELAGHSSPTLTARYSHRRLYDLAGAVEKLPRFLPAGTGGEAETLRATGTDGPQLAGGDTNPFVFSCPPVAQTDDFSCGPMITPEDGLGPAGERRNGPNPMPLQRVEAGCVPLRAAEAGTMERDKGYAGQRRPLPTVSFFRSF
jgi:excisionase family DNA binding protein